MRAAQRRGSRLRQPDVAHLALAYQLAHRRYRLLDLSRRADAGHPVQVDLVDRQATQALLDRAARVRRRAVDADRAAAEDEAELRDDHDLVPAARDCAPDQGLVVATAVRVGRVDQGDAEVERTADRLHRL